MSSRDETRQVSCPECDGQAEVTVRSHFTDDDQPGEPSAQVVLTGLCTVDITHAAVEQAWMDAWLGAGQA